MVARCECGWATRAGTDANAADARLAYVRFERKWRKDCPQVVKSLNEAGQELLTFYQYPKSMWKMLSTTNCVERLNEEFWRRVTTTGGCQTQKSCKV